MGIVEGVELSGELISKIEIPDVVSKRLGELNDKIVEAIRSGGFDGKTIDIGVLPSDLAFLKTFFFLIAEVDESLQFLNLCLMDLDKLKSDPEVFPGSDPFQRYKLIVKSYMYEYARFEDIFGYLLIFLERNSYLTKKERKNVRDEFYEQIKPMVKIRNTIAHDSYGWEDHMTMEITMLRSAQTCGMALVDKKTGSKLSWAGELGKLIDEKRPMLLAEGRGMRTFWSMLIADLTHRFVMEEKF